MITCFLTLIFGVTNGNNSDVAEYDIVNIYSAVQAEADTKVLTTLGGVEDAEYILVPTRIAAGTYEVSVTREETDFYKVDGKEIFIETRYCHEYANNTDVILVISGAYGYSKGELIFKD